MSPRRILATLIAFMPLSVVRVALYRVLLGYRIHWSARIGYGTVIAVRSVKIARGVRIGKFNTFKDRMELVIEEGAFINSFNEFRCTGKTSRDGSGYIRVGQKAHIACKHFFDCGGGITIGDMTRIAGRASQFWTHGGQRKSKSIVIGERCYVASGVRIAQGVEIAENCIVGLGSIVANSFQAPSSLIFGNPATVVKQGIVARLSLHRPNEEAQEDEISAALENALTSGS